MASLPPPIDSAEDSGLRGALFTDLDRLAFALEMEVAMLIEAGQDDAAAGCQHQRLGVRLAQRLVAGVWADEVHSRLQRWSDEYAARLANPSS
jgi:hypothetical protein